MEINSDSLRLILGIKVHEFRKQAGYSLKQLAKKSGLSISYLSEIEKGKKYPKPGKIIQIAQALEKPFDELISLQLDENQNPLASLMNSPVFREFPLEQFGITLNNVFELVNESPKKVGALIRALLEIGRNYDLHVETFLLASLRSYQKMHHNYFAELEATAQEFESRHRSLLESEQRVDKLTTVLAKEFACDIEFMDLAQYPELSSLRSIWIFGDTDKVIVNKQLGEAQMTFILLREIGYRKLGLTERPITSSWMNVDSFEQALNDFKASYFAGAVTLPEITIRDDLSTFLNNNSWEGEQFWDIMDRYRVTPETFLHRLSQILPHHFGLQNMHYLRLHNKVGSESYIVTKELNTTDVFVPRGVGPNEHHCRRWISISLLQQLGHAQQRGEHPNLLQSAQRSRFIQKDQTFFNFAMVRPLSLLEKTNAGMTLGFLIDDNFKQQVKFWNDSEVIEHKVNETCERCPLSDDECQDRVAPPKLLNIRRQQQSREKALQEFIRNAR